MFGNFILNIVYANWAFNKAYCQILVVNKRVTNDQKWNLCTSKHVLM